jgi:hypothetical protein
MPHFRSGKAMKEALEPSSLKAQREDESVRMRQNERILTDKPFRATSQLIEAAG